MGDWTELKLGKHEIMNFYERLPVFIVLLFDETDLRTYPDPDDNLYEEENSKDESYERRMIYEFQSTVKKVRNVLNSRGIDEDFCRNAFNELRSDKVWIGEELDYVPNQIDYDIYKKLLQEQLLDDSAANEVEEQPDAEAEKSIFNRIVDRLFDEEYPSFFWGQSAPVFTDIRTIIYLRTLFQIASENEPVTLSIHQMGNYDEMFDTFYQDYLQWLLKKIELDYRVYGFVLRNDPNLDIRLRAKIQKLTEDGFISTVLTPLLKSMGFADVKAVTSHGQGEFGKDILPFRRITEFNTVRYLAVQAKSVAIHGSAGKKGNAGELLSQAQSAFAVKFIDSSMDNTRKSIDEFVIATNKDITAEAKRIIEEGIENNRRITFLDIDRIVDLVKRYQLMEYVLFSIKTT